jgi:nucleoside-diphosphate-sugar epimerase
LASGVEKGRSTTENLIKLMARNGSRRLILVSSAAVHRPAHAGTVVDESLPVGPHPSWSQYVHQKLAAEALVMRANNDGLLRATVVRPTRVLGSGDIRLIPWATKLCTWVGGGLAEDHTFRHPVVVVRELARGLVACAESKSTFGQAYYLTSVFEITRGELLDIFKAAGMPVRRRTLTRSLGLAAGRLAIGSLEASGRAVWPAYRGPRTAVVAALERRAGIPVGHDCVMSPRKAVVDFGWQGHDDIELAIHQAVRWHLHDDKTSVPSNVPLLRRT